MDKIITSYVVVDELEALSYKLVAAEYARRADAEAALKPLREAYPESRVCELHARYDTRDPQAYLEYEAHKRRLCQRTPAKICSP